MEDPAQTRSYAGEHGLAHLCRHRRSAKEEKIRRKAAVEARDARS